MTMDMLTADQIIELRDHVTALLAADVDVLTPDERECLLGLDQRLERAIRQRAFHDSLTPSERVNTRMRDAYGPVYKRLADET
jgi:hypothetical protein